METKNDKYLNSCYNRSICNDKLTQSWKSENAFDTEQGSVSAPKYPHEYMVKCLSSAHNSGLKPLGITKRSKVLEIGCFGANNLRYFLDRGFSVNNIYGVEVTSSLVDMCKTNFRLLTNMALPEGNIKLGENNNIPFEDTTFDLIVSINTIHYSTKNEVIEALTLWKKKLKPNGRLFVETAGPDHDFVKEAKRKSMLDWQWGPLGGFREGSKAGFFDNRKHFQETINCVFEEASFGSCTEISEKSTVDFMTAYCVKTN